MGEALRTGAGEATRGALWALLVAMVLIGASATAAAQDGGEAAGGSDAPKAKAKVEAQTPSMYWGERRNVDIVQPRLFTKDGRMELTVFGGIIPNDPFLTYIPIGGRVAYYFVESIGVELSGEYSGGALQVQSDLEDYLAEEERFSATVDVLDRQDWRANATVVWSPFYGKMALLDSALSHFDVNLVAGFGAIQISSPPRKDSFDQNDVTEIREEGILGAGMRFFVTDALTVRLDYRQGIFRKVSGGVLTPSEVSLGVSYFLF